MSHKATQTSGTKPRRRRTGTLLPDLPTSLLVSAVSLPLVWFSTSGAQWLGPSSALTTHLPEEGSRGWGRVRCLFTRCERKKRPIRRISGNKGKKTGVTEKGRRGRGRVAGLAGRGSEEEKAAVPVPPLRPRGLGLLPPRPLGLGPPARQGSSPARQLRSGGERAGRRGCTAALLSLGAAAAAARGAGTRCG